MTTITNTINPLFASTSLCKLLTRQVAARKPASKQDGNSDTESKTSGALAAEANQCASFGDHTSARHLMRIIAESDAHAASIIGIVGAHRKAGVSVTSRQLAGAFASFGRKAMLVDASRVELSDVPNPSGSVSVPALPELADEVNSAISVVDLASVTGISTVTPAELGQALKDATQSGRMIIVDLPPISLKSGLPNKATSALASACNLVFLVCLTGAMRHKQLSECVETCKVIGLELNGLILNDWSLPASHLLDR